MYFKKEHLSVVANAFFEIHFTDKLIQNSQSRSKTRKKMNEND